MQFNQHNRDVETVNNTVSETSTSEPKTIFDYIVSWYGIVGATASIIAWYELHVRLGWWFFGM